MNKLWRVARHEYIRHVFRRRFIFAVISLPLMFGVTILVTFILARFQIDLRPAGYVDQSGLLADYSPPANPAFGQVALLPYADVAQARQALDVGEIQAYFVIPADYLASGQIQAVALADVGGVASAAVTDALHNALLEGQPPQIARRFTQGNILQVANLDGSRRITISDLTALFIPVFAFLAFMLSIFITSGYLMQSISEERENRTLEVMVSSLSPSQLMGGKTLGILGVGLTQLAIWIGAALAVLVFLSFLGIKISLTHFTPGLAALLIATLLPAMVIIASIMAAIGAVIADFNEGQQISGPFSLPFIVPLIFMIAILRDPAGPLSMWFTFIPFTAPATLVLRSTLSYVPPWQIMISLALLYLTALGALWLAGRAFRLGLLSYGRPIRLFSLFHRRSPAKGKSFDATQM